MERDRILLIDGDILLYRFAYGDEFTIQWEEGTESSYIDFDQARRKFDECVESSIKKTRCAKAILCFSVPTQENFRLKIFPAYKQNRTGLGKPQLYYDLKEHAFKNYLTIKKPTLEADDVLGILTTKNPKRYILMSGDKDLKQIYGYHYNMKTGQIERIGRKDADRWFYIQVLSGDTTDNYKGCPSIGKVKATAIVNAVIDEPEDTIWKTIVETYESKGLDEAHALTMARVARILRYQDYDHDKKEPILWTPTRR